MTYLQLVNKVLIRLREDQVAAVNENFYSVLIGDFVSQALREVENAWNWNALRTTVQVNTVSGTYGYSLTDVGSGYKFYDVHEDTQDYDLRKASYEQMNHWLLSSPQTDLPQYYDVNGVDSDGDPVVNLYPIPDGAYTINFNMKVLTKLDDDLTGSTSIVVPWLPVQLRALELAVEERGDDQGLSLTFLQQQFEKALGDAIAYDAALHADELIWNEE